MNTYADLRSAAIRHVWDHTEVGDAGWCMSVVCETRFDWNDIILWRRKPVKKETETTLFTTEATQQKEHTTHNLYIHPLPFRSIGVCIGVRTLHRSRHLASVLAPCIFLVCLSDDRLRTSSLVRAVTFFVVQGVCCCFTMPGPGIFQDKSRWLPGKLPVDDWAILEIVQSPIGNIHLICPVVNWI